MEDGSRAELAARSRAIDCTPPAPCPRPWPPAFPSPVRADPQALGQQATQQLAVGAVLRTADLADAVQAAERTRLAGTAEGHELVRNHVHRDVLRREGTQSEGSRDLTRPGAPLPAPSPPEPPPSAPTPSSCSLPANLGRLASGLRQLLGELGEEPGWHRGAGHVGIHHEHRHDGRGTARTVAQEQINVRRCSRET